MNHQHTVIAVIAIVSSIWLSKDIDGRYCNCDWFFGQSIYSWYPNKNLCSSLLSEQRLLRRESLLTDLSDDTLDGQESG